MRGTYNRARKYAPATDKAFTLIEIMVVVVIIGMLAGIVGYSVLGRVGQAQVEAARAQIKNFEQALQLYHLDNHMYPTTEQSLKALISKPESGKVPKNYREGGYLSGSKVPLDPWGVEYKYISPGLSGRPFDVICYGADGEPGGEGEAADITNY